MRMSDDANELAEQKTPGERNNRRGNGGQTTKTSFGPGAANGNMNKGSNQAHGAMANALAAAFKKKK
jgi:hypothetical protein